jgi:hypothetical protein
VADSILQAGYALTWTVNFTLTAREATPWHRKVLLGTWIFFAATI